MKAATTHTGFHEGFVVAFETFASGEEQDGFTSPETP